MMPFFIVRRSHSRFQLAILIFGALFFQSESLIAGSISYEQALQKAQTFQKTGSTPRLVLDRAPGRTEVNKPSAALTPAGRNKATAQQSANPPYYIFSRGEGKGYVILSGEDCLPEILGYTDNGDFVESDLPPALTDWLQHYADLVTAARAQNLPSRAVSATTATRNNIAPLIKTHWHQSGPYNNLCPIITENGQRSITGCVATAAAQIVYYYRKDLPDTLMATTPTYSYGAAPVTRSFPIGTPIKYDLMLPDYNSGYPAEMGTAVATLMAAVGHGNYLTYGSSTSGQIGDLVNTYSRYFNLKATSQYRQYYGGNWENMVYNELLSGRPMVYAGTSASNGSHAIVCDGYDATNALFHFNFGWGGQGDGYYTLDETTGVNGFSSQQGMVYGITPKKPALKAEIVKPTYGSPYMSLPVTVQLSNDGTLPARSFYLYATTTPVKPTNTLTAVAYDLTTVIPAGEKAELNLTFKPSRKGTLYLWLSDGQLNMLDSVSTVVQTSAPSLSLEALTVDAASLTDTVDGTGYSLVYNTSATVSAKVTNASDSYFEGSFRFILDEYVPGRPDSVTTSNQLIVGAFKPYETKTVSYTTSNLRPDRLYRMRLDRSVFAIGVSADLTYLCDSLVYFRGIAPDLSLDTLNAASVRVRGHWNGARFETMAAAYPNATRFDLKEVAGLSSQPLAPQPNALFYANDSTWFEGTNVIRQGRCRKLELRRGYDFTPDTVFFAEEALFHLDQSPGVWSTVCLPFDANVPDGSLFRTLKSHTTTSVAFTKTSKISSGTPCIFLTGSPKSDSIKAYGVTVDSRSANQGDTVFSASYSATVPATTVRILNTDNTQYFVAPDGKTVLPAFQASLKIQGVSSRLCPTNFTTDIQYKALASALAQASDTLAACSKRASVAAQGDFSTLIDSTGAYFTRQTATTDAEIKTKIQELETARYALLNTTGEPVDYSVRISNPSFELKNTKGWTFGNILYPSVQTISNRSFFTSGCNGSYLVYVMGKDSTGTDMYQTLTDLPNGTYRIKALIATNADRSVGLFANGDTTRVNGARFGTFYFNEGTVETVVKDGTLKLGITSRDCWYKADHFRLWYLNADTLHTGVTAPITTAMPETLTVLGEKGRLLVHTEVPERITVHHLSGLLVRTMNVQAGTTALEGLRPGIYLVNRKKVVVF